MNPQHLETITKAKQTANLLNGDIREAHKRACQDDPVLEILLRELIGDAVKMQNRLAEIEACFQ
jgi:hypothetical protein